MKYQLVDLTERFHKHCGRIFDTRDEAEYALLQELEKYPSKRFKIKAIPPKEFTPKWVVGTKRYG